MTLIPKTSVVPPGGFHFEDVSSGVSVRIEGDSCDDVARKMLQYRLAQGLPPGNPLEEYRAWLCGTWPHFCDDTASPQLTNTLSLGEHISRRVATWMASFIRNFRASEIVGQGEADRRAAICAACPKNIVYNATGCGSCLASIEQLSFVYKANRQTAYDSELRACDETGQHNGSAVWASNMPPVPEGAQLPSPCWRKAT